MTPDEERQSGKFNVQIGSVTGGQVTIGDYNTVSQRVGLSAAETAELRQVFEDLRAAVTAAVPSEQREQALTEAAEVEAAVIADQPDPSRARRALKWFRDNAPQLAGAVVGVLVNPLVGRVVEAAGDLVAGQFDELGAA